MFDSFRQHADAVMLRAMKARGDGVRTIGETQQPTSLLCDLGVCLQTAAHIEFDGWQTVMHAEGIDVRAQTEFLKYVELKFHTRDLLA